MVASEKLPQILQLTPSGEIVFQGPFEHVVTSYLELKNPSDKRVCFKVKTTAPRRYCVRPNSGIVEPDGKVKIAIMLQPMDADSQAERHKHKFMVQSTIINGDKDSQQTDEIWSNATPDEIMDSKLKCVFQEPDIEHQEVSHNKKDAETVPDVASKPSMVPQATTTSTSSHPQQQQAEEILGGYTRTNRASGDTRPNLVEPTTSTPVVSRVTSSTPKQPSSSTKSGTSVANQVYKRSADVAELRSADKSVASSHNLTSSFLHPMSDDYKIVLVSLAMLILGVILGKYII